MRVKLPKFTLLSSFGLALLVSGCASTEVPNTKACTAAGSILRGAICAETNTGKTSDMTYEEFLSFLEPVDGEGARSGAICQSAKDWGAIKTALERACRQLGSRCTFEMRQTIQNMNLLLSR